MRADQLRFVDAIPSLDDIVQAVETRSGLRIRVKVSEGDDSTLGRLWFGRICFEASPANELEIIAFQGSAPDDPASERWIEIRDFLQQEATLFFSTWLAIESLGGQARLDLPQSTRSKYAEPITIDELKKRRHRNAWPWVVMAPLYVPLVVITLGCMLVLSILGCCIVLPLMIIQRLIWKRG